ncbi:MAG: RNA polymerase sigma factor [Rhodoglobus sp.]
MEPIVALRTIHSVKVQLDDSSDWASALAGEGEGFGRIFDRHSARLLRHSRRLVTEPADADDVVAITFLEAWRSRSRLRLVDGSVLPWLLVTATNVASNRNRSVRRYRALLARLPAAEPSRDLTGVAEGTEASDALGRLSLADRRVVVLCVLEGYSEREAADALGVPPGTVKSRLSRAKQRLRDQLDSPQSPNTLAEEAGQ